MTTPTTAALTTHLLRALAAAGHTPGEPLAIAFSGGADSTALLMLAVEALPGDSLWAFHVDHAVRPTSADDADHCRSVGTWMEVHYADHRLEPFEVERRARLHGQEGALRELRYEALTRLCNEFGVRWLAVAHQADDALEGHLLGLIRGAGLAGLAGPAPTRDLRGVQLVRPLLDTPRSALLAWMSAHPWQVPWREDETNRDLRHARNRIRHEVIPVLAQLAGGMAPLQRSTATLREDRQALEAILARELHAQSFDPIALSLDTTPFQNAPERVLVEAIRQFVAAHTGGRPPARVHIEAVRRALAEPGRTRWIDLPRHRVRVERGVLSVEGWRPDAPEVPVRVGQPATALGVTIEASVEDGPGTADRDPNRAEFDLAQLDPNTLDRLVLRGARPGDVFRPFGLGGQVRLLRWLAGQGVPRSERTRVPVVAAGPLVLWVVDRRRSDAAPLSPQTERRLMLVETSVAETGSRK